LLLFVSSFLLPMGVAASDNVVMGKIRFKGESKTAKTSGVWVDGQYVGYLDELKGSKSVMLLPGQHEITVRQDGYNDFTQEVTAQPGETQVVRVAMTLAPTLPFPHDPAVVKIAVEPTRAAVFVDGQFVGHVGEFRGVGKEMLIAAGRHRIKIALPGYQTFETDINPIANQKVEVKTSLIRTDAPLQAPLVKAEASTNPPPESDNSMAAH
jgi:hypothetical protein